MLVGWVWGGGGIRDGDVCSGSLRVHGVGFVFVG